MKIENKFVLASHMARVLAAHANDVQNGLVGPYMKFLDGAATVNVTMSLSENGTLTVKELGTSAVPTEVEVKPQVEVTNVEAKTVPVRKRSPKWETEAGL